MNQKNRFTFQPVLFIVLAGLLTACPRTPDDQAKTERLQKEIQTQLALEEGAFNELRKLSLDTDARQTSTAVDALVQWVYRLDQFQQVLVETYLFAKSIDSENRNNSEYQALLRKLQDLLAKWMVRESSIAIQPPQWSLATNSNWDAYNTEVPNLDGLDLNDLGVARVEANAPALKTEADRIISEIHSYHAQFAQLDVVGSIFGESVTHRPTISLEPGNTLLDTLPGCIALMIDFSDATPIDGIRDQNCARAALQYCSHQTDLWALEIFLTEQITKVQTKLNLEGCSEIQTDLTGNKVEEMANWTREINIESLTPIR